MTEKQSLPATRMFPALTALALVMVCGIVHGVWTNRWGVSAEPAASAARLSGIALSLPDWEGREISVKPSAERGIERQLYREYVQRSTGKVVSVFLVCG